MYNLNPIIFESAKMKKYMITALCMLMFQISFSQPDIPEGNTSIPKFRLSMSGGAGYLMGSTKEAKRQLTSMGFRQSDVNTYYNQLKLSFPADASIHYLINESLGAGLHYSYFSTGAGIKDLVETGDGIHKANVRMEEQIYINFAGASLLFQQWYGFNKRMGVSIAYALGYVTYRNEAYVFNFPALITGRKIGMTGDIGLEYKIRPKFALGADLSYLTGTITKIRIDNGSTVTTQKLEKEQYENISRVALTAGFKFYF
jgi:hypothetical protein